MFAKAITAMALPSADSHRLVVVSEGGVRILRAEAYELRSAFL